MRQDEAGGFRLSVLGPIRAWRDGAEIDLGTPQQRALLALFLVSAGRQLTMDEIIDVLWPGSAPATAVNVVHRYVSRLRRLLPAGCLARVARGYHLDLDPQVLDLSMFRRLVAEATAVQTADLGRAVDLMVQALQMWHGPVAAGLSSEVRTAAVFLEIGREFTAAALQAAEMAVDRDAARKVLPALRAAATAAPLDEPLHAALMRVLSVTGRPADALVEFAALRGRLADELGVEPGVDVLSAYREILRAEPAQVDFRPMIRPAQVPADLPAFAGRAEHVDRVSSFLRGQRGGTGVARLAIISGMGGVGKTTLAVRCAHEVTADFPDGQLYVNMRGFDPSSTLRQPEEAVRGFLGALGVPQTDMPTGLEAHVALFRSLTAGRRILVVLDNVRDADQARPLLPAAPGCAALVTSRDPLMSLVVREAAMPTVLEPMSAEEAESYLEKRLGSERFAAEPTAAKQIISSCAGLPLALSIFVARAVTHPQFRLPHLVAELEASRGRLDCFGRLSEAPDLRAVFSWSYELLGSSAAKLFHLISLHPGHTFGITAAASLLGFDTRQASGLLRELTTANLISEAAPGRFWIHDLVRAYSGELLRAKESLRARQQATVRLLEHYLHSSLEAAALINPVRAPETVLSRPASSGVTLERLAGYRDAVDWFARERPTLMKMLGTAAAVPADPAIWQLAWAMENFLQRHHHWGDWERTQTLALAAARRQRDSAATARAHHSLGILYSDRALDLPDRCRIHLGRAIRHFAECGDSLGQAHALLRLGHVEELAGRPAEQRRHVERALEFYHEFERHEGPSTVPDYIAAAYEVLGEYDKSLPYALRSLDLLRGGVDRHREANAWATVGQARSALGQWPQALAADERAVLLFREAGDLFRAAQTLESMATRYAAGGRLLIAGNAQRRAMIIYARLGLPRASVSMPAVDRAGHPEVSVSRGASSGSVRSRPDRAGSGHRTAG